MNAACAQFQRELPWFIGGDLDRERAAATAEHLRTCLACRREAASLQQSHKALASLRNVTAAGIDDAAFAAMHADIMAAATRVPVGSEAPSPWPRALWIAAAALLFAFGWSLVRGDEPQSLFDRAPIPMATSTGEGAPLVSPFAGPRARVLPLSHDDGDAFDAWGSGMMRRELLRTLEDRLLEPRFKRERR